MEVRLLGELDVVDGDVRLDVRGSKQRTLLAALALHRGQPVSVDRLADALWGDAVPGNPGNALQAQVSQLRRTLGAATVVTRQGGYALVADLDFVRFEGLVEEGRRRLADGDAGGAAGLLDEAVSLCAAEPLAEFADAAFAAAERARLQELRLLALEARAEAELARGRHREAIGELEALCAEHPLRERLWALRMTALYRSGRQADALRAYADARRVLIEELGVEPGSELRRMEAMVLAQDPALDGPGSAAGAAGASAAVGAAPPSERPAAAGNVRHALTRFVGRADDLARLCELVGESRLITLVGPGGVGKTRLALETADARRDDFPHGTWLVELAGVLDAAGVAPAIASALGIAENARTPAGAAGATALDAIVTHLAGRSLLVVLDNCEHLIGEAATVAEHLLAAVPGLRLVATSREALAVPGEALVPVGPLPAADAVALFADRARTASPGFALDGDRAQIAADICRRLDGLPLAIELAAARLRALTVQQLAVRLDDRFRILTGGARTALPRHQTLRAVVDWSYELLFSDEQRLFRRLAVFPGGFSLADAEAVCGDDLLPADDVMDTVFRLVDKSLLAPSGDTDEVRFVQLQTLWQYARERLAETDEAEVIRARHAAWFRTIAEDAREGLRGATGPAWRARLTANLDNLRAALEWYVDAGDADAAAALVSGMAWLWFLNGDFHEGVRWLGDALAVDGAVRPEVRAMAQAWHGYFSGVLTNPAAAVEECEAAVAALPDEVDPVVRAEAILLFASSLMRVRGFERSLDAMREAHALLEQADYQWGLAASELLSALDLAVLGRLDEAEAAARASIARFDALGEEWFVVEPLGTLAGIAEARGDLDAAGAAYQSILDRCRAAHQPSYEPLWLVRVAGVRARQGEDKIADGLYEDAIACSRSPAVTADAMRGQAAVARRLGDLPRALALLDAAAAQYDSLGVATGRVAVLAERTWCALAADAVDEAAGLARQTSDAAGSTGDPVAELMAATVTAAVALHTDPNPGRVTAFVELAEQRRSRTAAFGGLTDDPDVAQLAARLRAPTAPPIE